MNERRGNWYLLTGLVLGLAVGLAVSWFLLPVQFTDTSPASLSEPYKDEYRRAVALAYQANSDLVRARERLKLLDPKGEAQALAAQAQRMLAENQPPQEARPLAVLAADLNRPAGEPSANQQAQADAETPTPSLTVETADPTETVTQTATPLATEVAAAVQTATPTLPTRTPTITYTPVPTFTPRPSATPIQALGSPFTLQSKEEICDGSVPPGLLQVYVYDKDGNPLPGVKITVSWEGGEEVFYTGLIQERGLGYADFNMISELNYSLQVGEASEAFSNISIPICKGSLKLEWSASK